MNARPFTAERPKVFQQAVSAPASEHSKWGNIPGLAEKLCGPCSAGQLSLGKTCRKEHFPPPCYLLVWVAGGLPLFNVLHGCQCQHSWHMNRFCTNLPRMRPQERYGSRRERQSMSITQFYASNITGKYGHLETIKPKLETHWKKKDSICTDRP